MMLGRLSLGLLALSVAPAGAAAQLSERSREFCELVEVVASSAMQARLNDVPMSHVVRQYSEIASEYPPIGDYILDVVLSAYDKPVALSGSDTARTVRDFANESYSTCVKGMREVN